MRQPDKWESADLIAGAARMHTPNGNDYLMLERQVKAISDRLERLERLVWTMTEENARLYATLEADRHYKEE